MNLTADYKMYQNLNSRLITMSTLLLFIFLSTTAAGIPAKKDRPLRWALSEKNAAIITGKVTDSDGTPLEGATITVSGTAVSTKSDRKGNFTITAGSDAILEVSFVGFKKIAINIGDQTEVSVQLNPLYAAPDKRENIIMDVSFLRVWAVLKNNHISKPVDSPVKWKFLKEQESERNN